MFTVQISTKYLPLVATTTISLYADPNVGGLAYFFEVGAIGTCSGPAGPARDRDADLTDDFHSACIDLIEAGVAGQGDVSTTGAGENGLLGCITVTDAAEAARILGELSLSSDMTATFIPKGNA